VLIHQAPNLFVMKLQKLSNGFIVFLIWVAVITAMILVKIFVLK
jgi:hypothetical protein